MKTKIFLLLIIVTNLTYSQNTITGQVLNSENETLSAFANVYFPELEKGTITNENGNFTISNLPNGRFNLLISLLGYETYSEEIKISQKNEPLLIFLNPSAVEMDEVIISTPFHKLQADNVMKIEQETISNLKKNGATTLSQGITNISGVESISTGNSIGKPVIRGLSSNRVLVYSQGVRLENQQFGAEHGLGLNDAGIESVEVIKGPASLLYGSDALGGVLYFNPERFANSNSNSADANFNYFSNTLGKSSNIGFKQSSDDFKFLIRGSFAEHADYKTNQYRVTNTRFNEKDLKIGLGYQKTNFKTELRYNLNSSKLGIPEEMGVQNRNTMPLQPYQDLNNHLFSSKTSIFFKESSLNINLGYIYNDRKEFEEHHDHEDEEEEEHEEALDAALHMKLKTFNYDVKYNLPQTGKLETIIGLQGMNQNNSNYGEELLIPDATTNDIGILATSHIHFEKMALQFGARFDNRTINSALIESETERLNKSFNSINGAIGLKTEFTDKLVSRLNIATGFRAPNLAELTSYGSHEGSNRFEIGNSNLKYEQNLQTDLALEFNSDHLEISVNGFYNSISNYIFLSPNGEEINDDPVYLYIQNNAKLYGGEIELHFHPHPFDWLHFDSSFSTVTGKLDNGSYLPLIPANNLNNTVRIEFGKRNWVQNGYAFIRMNTTFEQNNINEFETVTEDYTLLDIGFGGSLKLFKNDLEISISATNLTDKEYINHLSRLKPDGILNMGRSVNFGVSYKL
jgi:iron complex outermembrane receptor protein